jgi:hypothetical protein
MANDIDIQLFDQNKFALPGITNQSSGVFYFLKIRIMSNIKLFESKQIRSVWNETDQKWYFSVQDVIEVLTDSADVKQYKKRVKPGRNA